MRINNKLLVRFVDLEVDKHVSKEFKSKFSIPRYNALLAKDFDKAKRYLMKWEPDDAFAYRIAYRKGVKK
ncbi:MAG: ORF6C domain-containing protein [Leuconostoc pseudomesenteroides]|uniref:ORF6C domain-containing protein n=1 Tax=Leuconostoc pseudomesenteroides TaxID=33968 RepID=UPI0039E8A593